VNCRPSLSLGNRPKSREWARLFGIPPAEVATMTDGVTKTDLLYLKQQLNRIEDELERIKKLVQKVLSRQE
jgi:hypothetical protein